MIRSFFRRDVRGFALSDGIALVALAASIVAAWIAFDTKREQYSERLSVSVDPYAPQFLGQGVACAALAAYFKPYRITLINTGNIPLSITESNISIGDGHPYLSGSRDLILLGDAGAKTPLPLKLEPADSRVYYTVAAYPLTPAITSLLCAGVQQGQPAPDREEAARILAEASVDLAGRPAPLGSVPYDPAGAAWSGTVSDLPRLRVTITTAKNATFTAQIIDKAIP